MTEEEFRRLMGDFEDMLESFQDAGLLSAKGEDFRHMVWKKYVEE
ncbi:unnamed protein product [marine sediment metagenome]|uniref:Uncharacterized protein n=1 Tax=marine sediment metagenome TaxID=412755 RepID=X1JIU0_9ZZZZ